MEEQSTQKLLFFCSQVANHLSVVSRSLMRTGEYFAGINAVIVHPICSTIQRDVYVNPITYLRQGMADCLQVATSVKAV